jgi:hypothetical protein
VAFVVVQAVLVATVLFVDSSLGLKERTASCSFDPTCELPTSRHGVYGRIGNLIV